MSEASETTKVSMDNATSVVSLFLVKLMRRVISMKVLEWNECHVFKVSMKVLVWNEYLSRP